MKVIDLLNKIANKEEVPKKIKLNSETYKYNGRWEDYEIETGDEYFFQTMLNRNRDMSLILNEEIEIIEEKPKKIVPMFVRTEGNEFVIDKMNELIKAVNYLLEKESDK